MASDYDPLVRTLHSESEDDLVLPWCSGDSDHGRCKAYLAKVISVDQDEDEDDDDDEVQVQVEEEVEKAEGCVDRLEEAEPLTASTTTTAVQESYSDPFTENGVDAPSSVLAHTDVILNPLNPGNQKLDDGENAVDLVSSVKVDALESNLSEPVIENHDDNKVDSTPSKYCDDVKAETLDDVVCEKNTSDVNPASSSSSVFLPDSQVLVVNPDDERSGPQIGHDVIDDVVISGEDKDNNQSLCEVPEISKNDEVSPEDKQSIQVGVPASPFIEVDVTSSLNAPIGITAHKRTDEDNEEANEGGEGKDEDNKEMEEVITVPITEENKESRENEGGHPGNDDDDEVYEEQGVVEGVGEGEEESPSTPPTPPSSPPPPPPLPVIAPKDVSLSHSLTHSGENVLDHQNEGRRENEGKECSNESEGMVEHEIDTDGTNLESDINLDVENEVVENEVVENEVVSQELCLPGNESANGISSTEEEVLKVGNEVDVVGAIEVDLTDDIVAASPDDCDRSNSSNSSNSSSSIQTSSTDPAFDYSELKESDKATNMEEKEVSDDGIESDEDEVGGEKDENEEHKVADEENENEEHKVADEENENEEHKVGDEENENEEHKEVADEENENEEVKVGDEENENEEDPACNEENKNEKDKVGDEENENEEDKVDNEENENEDDNVGDEEDKNEIITENVNLNAPVDGNECKPYVENEEMNIADVEMQSDVVGETDVDRECRESETEMSHDVPADDVAETDLIKEYEENDKESPQEMLKTQNEEESCKMEEEIPLDVPVDDVAETDNEKESDPEEKVIDEQAEAEESDKKMIKENEVLDTSADPHKEIDSCTSHLVIADNVNREENEVAERNDLTKEGESVEETEECDALFGHELENKETSIVDEMNDNEDITSASGLYAAVPDLEGVVKEEGEDRISHNNDSDVISFSTSGQVCDEFGDDASGKVTETVGTAYGDAGGDSDICDDVFRVPGFVEDTECREVSLTSEEHICTEGQSDVTEDRGCILIERTDDDIAPRTDVSSLSYGSARISLECQSKDSLSLLSSRDRSSFLAKLLQTSDSPTAKDINVFEFPSDLKHSEDTVPPAGDLNFTDTIKCLEDTGVDTSLIGSVSDDSGSLCNQLTEEELIESLSLAVNESEDSGDYRVLLPEKEPEDISDVNTEENHHFLVDSNAVVIEDVSTEANNDILIDSVPVTSEDQIELSISQVDDLGTDKVTGTDNLILCDPIPSSSAKPLKDSVSSDDDSSLSISDEDELISSIITVIAADQVGDLTVEIEEGNDADSSVNNNENENPSDAILLLNNDSEIVDSTSASVLHENEAIISDEVFHVTDDHSDSCALVDRTDSESFVAEDPINSDSSISENYAISNDPRSEDDIDSCVTIVQADCLSFPLEAENQSDSISSVTEDQSDIIHPITENQTSCDFAATGEDQVEPTCIGSEQESGLCDSIALETEISNDSAVLSLTEDQVEQDTLISVTHVECTTSVDENPVDFVDAAVEDLVDSIVCVAADQVDLHDSVSENPVNDSFGVQTKSGYINENSLESCDSKADDQVDSIACVTEELPDSCLEIEVQDHSSDSTCEDQIQDYLDSTLAEVADNIDSFNSVVEEQANSDSVVTDDQVDSCFSVVENQVDSNSVAAEEHLVSVAFVTEDSIDSIKSEGGDQIGSPSHDTEDQINSLTPESDVQIDAFTSVAENQIDENEHESHCLVTSDNVNIVPSESEEQTSSEKFLKEESRLDINSVFNEGKPPDDLVCQGHEIENEFSSVVSSISVDIQVDSDLFNDEGESNLISLNTNGESESSNSITVDVSDRILQQETHFLTSVDEEPEKLSEEEEEVEEISSTASLISEVEGIDFIGGVVKDGWHSLPPSAVEGKLPFDSFLSVIEEEDQIDSIPPVIGIDKDQTESSPRGAEVEGSPIPSAILEEGGGEKGVGVEECMNVLTPPAPGGCVGGCVELQGARDEANSQIETDEGETLALESELIEVTESEDNKRPQYMSGFGSDEFLSEEDIRVEDETLLVVSGANGNDPDEVSDFNDAKVGENDASEVGVTSAAADSLDVTKDELDCVATVNEVEVHDSVSKYAMENVVENRDLPEETCMEVNQDDEVKDTSGESLFGFNESFNREDWVESIVDMVMKSYEARVRKGEENQVIFGKDTKDKIVEDSPSSSERCQELAQVPSGGDLTGGEMSESSNRDSGTSYLSEADGSDDDTLVGRSSDGDGMIMSSSEEGSGGSSGVGNSDLPDGESFSKCHRRDDSGVVMGTYQNEHHLHHHLHQELHHIHHQHHHHHHHQREQQQETHTEQSNILRDRDQEVPNESHLDHEIKTNKRNSEDEYCTEPEDNNNRTLERGMSLADLEGDDDTHPFSRFRRSRNHQFRVAKRFSGQRMVKKMKKVVHFGKKTGPEDNGNHPHPTKIQDSTDGESFGKRSGGGGRRANECLILEPSEMIVIDYPDVQLMRPGQRASCNTMNLEKLMALEQDEITIRPGGRGAPPPPPSHHHPSHQYDGEHQIHPHHHHHHDPYLPDLVGSAIMRGARSRGSVGSSVRDGSDTSSAYSGSDTMCHSLHSSLEPDDVDLSGLTESAVDSDEEDLAESMESLAVRDQVRECLEKDPSERTDDDIEILLEFTQRLQAFSNMTLAVRRAMCQAMVFAVVEDAGTTLMNHGEELDSWSVIINGHVEVTQADGSVHELHLGDSFGITPTMEKLYHQGVMRSKVDDCQFVCIRQTDYYRILHQGEENTRRIEENGIVVLVTEQRPIDGGNRKGNIVIKGTAEKLMCQLVEVENNVDPTYVEDFLLTHRTFVDTPLVVANKLLHWFEDPSLRDRVTRVVLLWVNNHFTDFEMDLVMMNFLEQFEEGLEREKMAGQLRLLDFACATKARARVVTLTRPSREDILHFSILGGYERGYGIFISNVEKGSKAEEVGLKRGDQILEVNGQSFDHMNHARALEILRQPCHLSITVKSNLLAFKEMLTTPDNSPRPHTRKTSDVRGLSEGNGHMPMNNFSAGGNIPSDHTQQSPREKGKEDKNKASFMTIGASTAKQFKKKIINSFVPKPSAPESQMNSDESVSSQSSVGGGLYHSHSNPDLSTAGTYEDVRTEFPEHVLKVYRATDHNARFLPVHKETTAREVVMLALQIFNINDPTGSSNYALYEVTVTEEGITKQRRLPDSLQNLAERIGLSSRYYLKNITVSQTLVPDDIVNELVRESAVCFLQLNSVELAIQLTLEDYTIFRQIEPTEYIDYLFNLKSNYGTPALSQFAGLVNREMFWVVTEVCSEHNLVKRSKIIKQFIKVARQCKECKNFNSMFAILSGLGHGAVSRLKQTWERLPNKYLRMFKDMQELMDPSRNMSKYRNLVQNENIQSPIIPFYPVVARDLTFTHEGNDDKVDGLINFEKLRMISRYIRDLQNMCSAPYDLFNIQDAGGQPPSSALISLNQMAAGGHQIATVKRRKKSTAAPDKKKMYEEAQMVRRVKAYLSRLQVVTDEEQLRNMSLECEGGPEGHKTGGGSVGHHQSSNSNSGSSSAPPTNPPPRRRPHSPTPSTTSSTSSTSQTSDGKKQTTKFGATSPQSISKMKALAEPKTKPHHGPRSNNTHHSLSPSPSPGPPRKGAMTNHNSRSTHERSHSDTHAVPVDLSAESSSVTSLSKLHKSHTSGSVTSSECQVGPGESDSGISTHFDCHSSSSLEVGGVNSHEWHYHSSPPAHHRRYSHQPESRSRPPFPHAIPVLPPVPTTGMCNNRVRRGASGVPPDYVATQLRMKQMGRALSHDGVQYYHHSHHDDEEEDAQVSAV